MTVSTVSVTEPILSWDLPSDRRWLALSTTPVRGDILNPLLSISSEYEPGGTAVKMNARYRC